jgi:hypothetical protein
MKQIRLVSIRSLMRAAFLASCVLVMCLPLGAEAYKLKIKDTAKNREYQPKARYFTLDFSSRYLVALFSENVHEEITNRTFGCTGPEHDNNCGSQDATTRFSGEAVIAGVRWNDNPSFGFDSTKSKSSACRNATQTVQAPSNNLQCWLLLFHDAKTKARNRVYTSGDALMQRSHFGDMQFLHSMASGLGEKAKLTKRNILNWAEFTFRVSRGELQLGSRIWETGAPDLREVFHSGSDKMATVQTVLTWGREEYRGKEKLRDFALGSLLHMVQDSFAEGHVRRGQEDGTACPGTAHLKPGKVLEFHTYVGQNTDNHANFDSRSAFKAHLAVKPNVVDVGKVIVAIVRSPATTWNDLRAYLDCVYDLDNPEGYPTVGDKFE